MPTDKKTITFYATPEVEHILAAVPSGDRTRYINRWIAMGELADRKQNEPPFDIANFIYWGKHHSDPLVERLAEILDQYIGQRDAGLAVHMCGGKTGCPKCGELLNKTYKEFGL